MSAFRPSVRFLLLPAVAVAVLAGCGSSPEPAAEQPPADPATAPGNVEVQGTFASGTGPAFTYNPQRVPVGSRATVQAVAAEGTTRTTLTVSGLNPNSTYGAHAHARPCGPTGDAAGPHYQFRQDPVTPSVDPAYANPSNEIWLDVRTDAQGNGTSTSSVPWAFPLDRRAQSVILHDMATMTEPGKAGTAGSRPACLDVRF